MKLLLTWLCTVLLAFTNTNQGADRSAMLAVQQRKTLTAIGCTPNWENININALANEMGPLPGSGKWKWTISSSNDSAQFYFNQGINLYYGFHIVESVPSFRKAQQFDPNCAILYWGEALALGPNINDVGYASSAAGSNVANRAKLFLPAASEKEKQLVEAMLVRYSEDSSENQSRLNEQYAAAMHAVYLQNDRDPDIGSLYADALMLLHPWDFWEHNGQAKSWTPEIVVLLEKVLEKAPLHPGANHYYIHVVEASDQPGRAKKSADRLVSLAPSLSHLVHMPSHIYVRTGDFEKGIQVNTAAVKGYALYKTLFPSVVDKIDLYEIHNRHMQVACAIHLDNYERARALAADCRKSIPEEWLSIPGMGYYVQYIYLSPEFAMAAFGKWDEILQQEAVPEQYLYARILQAFSKGLAHVQKGHLKAATQELEKIGNYMTDSSLKQAIGAMNAPISGSLVAQAILTGAIAAADGQTSKALAAYARAVQLEDDMIYNEPKDWLLPARRWLGEALLKSGDLQKAREVFESDLQKNPGSIFALKGLNAVKKTKNR